MNTDAEASEHPSYSSLAEYLEKTGITQAELARQVGVTQPVISKIVRRQRAASGRLALALHRVTGVPLEHLLEVAA